MLWISALNGKRLPPATVLVVDDTAIARYAITNILEGWGFFTLQAADGRAALEIISRCKPDALVTDIDMPHLSGFELIDILRSSRVPDLRRLPILVASSRIDERTKEQLNTLKVDGFIPKPIDVRVLALEVEHAFSTQA